MTELKYAKLGEDRLGRPVGVIPLDTIAEAGGLAVMKGMLDGRLPGPPIGATLNFWVSEVEEGRVVFSGLPTEAHLNPLGTIHGGWASAIMDSALACCVMTTLAPGEGYTTVEFKVNLVRPLLPGMGEVRCEGKVVHRGRTIATSECFLHDDKGRLLAHGTETCAIFSIDKMRR